MHSLTDTVVAPITGLNRAAVAVVRLSGPAAWTIGSQVFTDWPVPTVARVATYGRFVTGDDGFVLPFRSGASYTGDETVEMSVHGSLASVGRLIDSCLRLGARAADPGEFTYRAFMNGRIDLTQAEGVRDTVEALTESQLRQANRLREGSLRSDIERAADLVWQVVAAVEAATDFEEETGPIDRGAAVDRLRSSIAILEEVSKGASFGRIVREGVHVAITGRPNAGKSSLLNALAGTERAIVTSTPGTTRDTVEAVIEHQGIVLTLVDTAGLRETDDMVEAIGVKRSLEAVADADVVWYVFDSSIGWSEEDGQVAERLDRSFLKVANKSDLSGPPGAVLQDSLPVSALTGEGAARLLDATVALVASTDDEPALLNRRHAPLVAAAIEALQAAENTLLAGAPHDLAAVHLQRALRSCGEVTGTSVDDETVHRLFSTFCIGK